MDILYGHPNAIYALWGLLPLGLLLERARRRRIAASASLLDPAMALRLMPTIDPWRSHVPTLFLLLAFTSFVFAAARPRFGVHYEQVTRRGADIVVLLDVSRSMLSEDVYPSRLERARSYIKDLTARLQGDRIGLVVFAGRAIPSCPLTLDHRFFEMILNDVGPDSAPRGGTAIGDAIRVGLESIDGYGERDRAFVLITDGEDQDSFPLEAAAAAADQGVKIFTVGIGDPNEGARIPMKGTSGGLTYMKFDGEEVWSKLDESTLKQIALKTGGAYVPAQTGTYDLGQIYVDHLSELQAGELLSAKRKRFKERHQIFTALGLLFYLLSILVPTFRAPTLFPTFLVAAIVCGGNGSLFAQSDPNPQPPTAAAPQDPQADQSEPDQREDAPTDAAPVTVDRELRGTPTQLHNRAIERFHAGDFVRAAEFLDRAVEASDHDPRIEFALGATRQALHEQTLAERAYDRAVSGSTDVTLAGHYNLGTLDVDAAKSVFGPDPSQAKGESRKEGVAKIESAISHFRAALRIDPEHEDARHNIELLRLWLKHMKDVWKKQDQEQEPPNSDESLVDALARLAKEQRTIRTEYRRLIASPSSPKRTEELGQLVVREKELSEEVKLVGPKLAAEFDQLLQPTPPGGAPGGAPSGAPGTPALTPEQREQVEQAKGTLLGAIDQLVASMVGVNGPIESQQFDVADASLAQVEGTLWQMFGSFAKFHEVLRRMEESEEQIVGVTAPLVEAAPGTAKQEGVASSFLAEDQAVVGGWGPHLVQLAESMLPLLEQQLEQLATAGPSSPGNPSGVGGQTGGPPGQPGGDPEEMKKNLEGLRVALQRAIERGPEIAPLAEQSVTAISAGDFEQALPAEEEILRILREIGETLPKEENESGDNGGGQDKQSGDPEKDDEKKEGSDQEKSQDPSNPDSEENPSEATGEPEPVTMSQEELEKLLQQAMDRQEEYKEKKKSLERLLGKPVIVERDW